MRQQEFQKELLLTVSLNQSSVQTWRSMYISGGIDTVLNYQKRDGRPSVLTKEEHQKIEE